ncbi:MAG: hypothetical protein M3450_02855 [Actinomycetota bacterium]|nr:hypothetical protein [Actinomycetota bacterium]
MAWHVAENVKALRSGSAEALAASVQLEDVPMNRSALANIESHRRADLTLEELAALAIALNVSPTNLLLPPEGAPDRVAVTPKREDHASFVRQWIYGRMRLPSVAEEFRDSSGRDLDAEFRIKAAPESERREGDERFSRHPISFAVAELMTYVRDGVLGPTQYMTPELLASAIRRAADNVSMEARRLADELDAKETWE